RRNRSDGCRPNQESVLIEMQRGVIFVVVVAHLGGVALGDEVLNKEIGQCHLLMPVLKGVEAAIGILLEEPEIGGVVLQAIGVQIAEQAGSRLLLQKQQAAKIAVELLHAHAQRDEIVVGAQVG